jgi:hypothetical protein
MIVRDTQPSMIVRDNQRTRRKAFEEFSTEDRGPTKLYLATNFEADS